MIQRPITLLGQYAGFVSRGAALLIDIGIISAVIFGTIAVTNAFVTFFDLRDILESIISNVPLFQAIFRFFVAFGAAIFVLLYETLFWTLTGGYSPGKYIMGVRIVRTNAHRITLGRALLRYIFWWISALALGLGFFWVLLDNRRQGWHDRVAGTYVIYAWDAREDPLILNGIQRRVTQIRESREQVETGISSAKKSLGSGSSTSAETDSIQPPTP